MAQANIQQTVTIIKADMIIIINMGVVSRETPLDHSSDAGILMSIYVNQTAKPGADHVSSEQSREELMTAHWSRPLFSWSTYGILQSRKVVPSQITSVC